MIRVNFPRIVQGVMALGQAAKSQPVQLAGFMARVASVGNSPVSLAKNQDAPAQFSLLRKRQAPQPTAEMIQQAIERKFQEGIASGTIKTPDVTDSAKPQVQTMAVDLSPVKLASNSFLQQGGEQKLKAMGEMLAKQLEGTRHGALPMVRAPSDEATLTPRAEKIALDLRDALRARMAGAQKASEPVAKPTESASSDKPVSQMSALEAGLFKAARERELRLQQ
ncbi:hypothetical protein [Vagococcus sp. WN89Y]|uniref:hypothetical protein n=1 Tax=Vagococcus sp. WN89Y TaxID=3457258 RepID=UPI003FCE8EF4